MNTKTESTAGAQPPKAYTAPTLRREARIELVTAGSFDLNIPNAP